MILICGWSLELLRDQNTKPNIRLRYSASQVCTFVHSFSLFHLALLAYSGKLLVFLPACSLSNDTQLFPRWKAQSCFVSKHCIVRCNSCTASQGCIVSKHGSIQLNISIILYIRALCPQHGGQSAMEFFYRVVQLRCTVLYLKLREQFSPRVIHNLLTILGMQLIRQSIYIEMLIHQDLVCVSLLGIRYARGLPHTLDSLLPNLLT